MHSIERRRHFPVYDPGVTPEDEAKRRAAALAALQQKAPATPPAQAFWQRHGARIAIGAALLLGLVLIARAVGSFMRTSVSETNRAEQDLRKGLR
jgi:hypothetical protein